MSNSKFEETYKQKYAKPKKKKEKTNLVAIRLPHSIYTKIKRLSTDTDTSMSHVIIDALKSAFGEENE